MGDGLMGIPCPAKEHAKLKVEPLEAVEAAEEKNCYTKMCFCGHNLISHAVSGRCIALGCDCNDFSEHVEPKPSPQAEGAKKEQCYFPHCLCKPHEPCSDNLVHRPQPSSLAGTKLRINDQPPTHWTENDGWSRHPQSADEWNWNRDAYPGTGDRSERRLNFAVDRADPHAPDQMAIVLRIDLMRIMGRMHSAEAYKKFHKSQSHPVIESQPAERPEKLVSDEWVEEFAKGDGWLAIVKAVKELQAYRKLFDGRE